MPHNEFQTMSVHIKVIVQEENTVWDKKKKIHYELQETTTHHIEIGRKEV